MPRLDRAPLLAALLTGVLLAAGCGGDDPMEPEPVDPAPEPGPADLSGTYTLQSFNSGALTGGTAVTPPEASGMFTVEQTSATEDEASGTFEMTVSVPDGAGGTVTLGDEGTYKNTTDGQLEQAGQLYQTRGTYELDGDTLRIDVAEPVLAISKTVWLRQ